MLGAFRGTAVHAPWTPYFHFTGWAHALCHAHHLRELQFIHKQYQQPWANDMAELLGEIKAAVDKPPTPAVSLAPSHLEAFAQRYDEVVQAGIAANPRPVPQVAKRGRPQQPPPLTLALRLHDCKALGLAFMDDFRVPFDNNQGERDIRMVNVTQKVSGGFRTLEGAQRFSRMRGYLSTVRKQAKNVCEAIRAAFDGPPFMPSPETH